MNNIYQASLDKIGFGECLQETVATGGPGDPGTQGHCNLEKPARIALKSMDANGVKISLLRPMPQTPGQNLHLYFEDLLPIVQKYPDRFAALGRGASLNVMIQQSVREGRVTLAMQKSNCRKN